MDLQGTDNLAEVTCCLALFMNVCTQPLNCFPIAYQTPRPVHRSNLTAAFQVVCAMKSVIKFGSTYPVLKACFSTSVIPHKNRCSHTASESSKSNNQTGTRSKTLVIRSNEKTRHKLTALSITQQLRVPRSPISRLA